MTGQMPQMTHARPAVRVPLMAVLALAGAVALSAGSTTGPVRLVGVSAQGSAVLIEASEPVAYTVSRPDLLTVLVDLRNVSSDDAVNLVERRDPISRVTIEQANAIDGKALARVRVALARPMDHKARSARNTIRLELSPASRVSTAAASTLPLPSPAPAPPVTVMSGAEAPDATVIADVRAEGDSAATRVILTGDGRLTPGNVTESEDQPRRLILDFPNIGSKAPLQTAVQSALVNKVRVAVNSRTPLLTRVVLEIAATATYHVARAGADGRDLAIVFEPAQASGTVMLTPMPAAGSQVEPEPGIRLEEAIANAATITPADNPVDPMSALKLVPQTPPATTTPPAEQPPAPKPQTPQPQAPAQTPAQTPPPQQTPPSPQRPISIPVSQPPATQQLGPGDKQYTGYPISLDFSGADLRAVLRVFPEVSGLNFIIHPSVQGTVDVYLKDVPWDQALETILRDQKLGYVVDGTIVRIAPLNILAEEEAERRKLSEAKALAGDLRVQTFALSYAKAEQMSPLLVKSALSSRGQIQVDTRTNTLVITDLPDRLQTATALIGSLDRPEPQVEVEARIVQTTRDFARAIGVQWGLNGRMMPDIGNTTNLAFPNRGTLGGRTGAANVPNDPRSGQLETTGTAVNLPVTGATSAIGLALGAVNGAFNLDVALSALERSGKGRVLSTPRLTTQNNIMGEVAQGVQIPIQVVANNTITVTFKEAVLILQVTPQITAAGTVIMQITIENASADFSRQVNGIPPIDTQRAKTQVQVDDGATTVIGGIFVSREQTSTDKTPILHRIPLLGWLFRRDSATDESRELLIFITPRILKG
jgi:type IV pilus assembly protein PilQ